MANSFFYTDANGNKQGPLTPEQLQTLATKGIITPDTLLESEAGQQGKAGQIRGLKFNIADPSPSTGDSVTKKKPFNVAGTIEKLTASFKNLNAAAPSSTGSFGEMPPNAVAAINKLNFHYRVMHGCLAAGLVLLGIFVLLRGVEGGDAIYYFANFMLLVAGAVGIVGGVFGLILLYQLWKVIPEDIARTTPPNAVGFMLVPLFFSTGFSSQSSG